MLTADYKLLMNFLFSEHLRVSWEMTASMLH